MLSPQLYLQRSTTTPSISRRSQAQKSLQRRSRTFRCSTFHSTRTINFSTRLTHPNRLDPFDALFNPNPRPPYLSNGRNNPLPPPPPHLQAPLPRIPRFVPLDADALNQRLLEQMRGQEQQQQDRRHAAVDLQLRLLRLQQDNLAQQQELVDDDARNRRRTRIMDHRARQRELLGQLRAMRDPVVPRVRDGMGWPREGA